MPFGHDRGPVQIVDESNRAGMITADSLSQSLPDVKKITESYCGGTNCTLMNASRCTGLPSVRFA